RRCHHVVWRKQIHSGKLFEGAGALQTRGSRAGKRHTCGPAVYDGSDFGSSTTFRLSNRSGCRCFNRSERPARRMAQRPLNQTFSQYAGERLDLQVDAYFDAAREKIARSISEEQLAFFRQLPLYHEDEFAIYVHAGLEEGKHPRDSSPHALLWTRDSDFYKN